MTKFMTAVLTAGLLAAVPSVVLADGHRQAHARVSSGAVAITVSCARYSLPGVIWDRPMPIFLDDLAAAGYTPERAFAIGNRVCRDEALVGNTAAMGATMQNILRTQPPRR